MNTTQATTSTRKAFYREDGTLSGSRVILPIGVTVMCDDFTDTDCRVTRPNGFARRMNLDDLTPVE